ncbi:unnamed protein product [Litomosoides sigmodontis]|uniref:TIL domain-containing protein n=1 Tax=Litomosoides sigmodontis TaxID=42156 RepID=A0A3P6TA20_LITSI|nr:unnamed protein product [Litomosoides sigmodontis]
MIALVLIATHVDTSRRRSCDANEIWTDCRGCELQCGESEFTPCVAMCYPAGCYCPPYDGFRRNRSRKCVAISECPEISVKDDGNHLNNTS